MFGFNPIKNAFQWIGSKAKKVQRTVGQAANHVVKKVIDIVNFPKWVIDNVNIYKDITKNSILKQGKPVLDALTRVAAYMSDTAYHWTGAKRRADEITIDGKKYTKLYDDQHGIAYEDDNYCYISYRGTDTSFNLKVKGSLERTISDLHSDLQGALGKVPKARTDAAVVFFKKVKSMTKKKIKFITGHSLGGYLAKHVHFYGTSKKVRTIVFNAFEHPNQKSMQSSKLIVHRIFGDPVSTFSGVSSSRSNRFLYKMQYNFPSVSAHSLNLFL